MTDAPVRFGLLGTGHWARVTGAQALAAHPGAELVGVWGRDPAKAEALAHDVGTRAYADADALIADVDAIAVALPPDVQAPLAARAAAAGRHLLLDKPLALSTAAADEIVAAVERAGVRSVVFHTARFTPQGDAWVAEARAAGGWLGGDVRVLAGIFVPGNPFGASPWRRERGALWDVGPHALDAVVSTLGPVEDLVAARGPGDAVHLVLRHRGGASSTLTLSLTAPEEAETFVAQIYGPRGTSVRPASLLTPAEAFGNAISALLAGGHPSDVRHGRDLVAVLERADALLGGPATAAG